MAEKEIRSINPFTGELLAIFNSPSRAEIDQALSQACEAFQSWSQTPIAERAGLMVQVGAYLRKHQDTLAPLITAEMGKPIAEAEAEVEKCAWNCDYFAARAEDFLAPESHPLNGESYVQFRPLGVILAIMPWNFPFWQVFRFAAPVLMAGNGAILKHASNVPHCAMAIEEVFKQCHFPNRIFQTILLPANGVDQLIEDPRVEAVSITGSDHAGSRVAEVAGRAIKKAVLELGGSDPFIVLEDADLNAAVKIGVKARFQNAGQSCIAAKRFIVVVSIFEEFERRIVAAVKKLRVGDPMDRSTDIGPLAREDLRDTVGLQVERSLAQGARLLTGGKRLDGPGFFYQPTVLSGVTPEMPAFSEELFGPVASLIEVKNDDGAIEMANRSAFGLGASLWTADLGRARRLASRIEAGQVFINGMVASDPRLPFGGIKRSGYGRELSKYGIREFVNVQTVSIAPAKN